MTLHVAEHKLPACLTSVSSGIAMWVYAFSTNVTEDVIWSSRPWCDPEFVATRRLHALLIALVFREPYSKRNVPSSSHRTRNTLYTRVPQPHWKDEGEPLSSILTSE
jgi:hypothetical protein